MRFSLLTLIAFIVIQTLSEPRASASNFQEVYAATASMLSGKVFRSEDGSLLSFGGIQLISGGTAAFLPVTIESIDGIKQSHFEFIDKDGTQVRMSKVVQAQVEGTFSVTVSLPYNVLSIRPLEAGNVEFLSRDCVLSSTERIHICYIKTKVGNEVFSAVYRQVTRNND